MPPAGIDERADQLALLEGEVHARRTTAEMGDLIGAAESRSDLTELDRALVRELRRGYDRATRLPGDLVKAMARPEQREPRHLGGGAHKVRLLDLPRRPGTHAQAHPREGGLPGDSRTPVTTRCWTSSSRG